MRLRLLLEALLAATMFLSFGTSADAQRESTDSCVRSTCDTRYVAYGYNHIVHLENTCGRPMRCTVASDSNPQPTTAELASGQSKDVQVFVGSPASVCRAVVTCSPR